MGTFWDESVDIQWGEGDVEDWGDIDDGVGGDKAVGRAGSVTAYGTACVRAWGMN